MRGHMDHPPRFQEFSVEWGNWAMPPPFGSFGGPDFHGCHHRPRFGPVRRGESTEHHHPGHQRRGPHEGRGGCCSSDSDNEERCCGPRDFRRGPGGRFGFMHGPFGFGQHGPSMYDVRPWRGPWNRPCRGPGAPWDRPWRGPYDPLGGQRGPCPSCDHKERNDYDRPGCRRYRKDDCEKCCENEPCRSGNKEKRGAKDHGPCNDKDKDENTVFVQRIVLEKSARPQSV